MATGNPRNKTALLPGRSLMDWVRLTNTAGGANLSGVDDKLRPLSVSTNQLAEHCVEQDAWLALRGAVYNVTRYLQFHPGGVDELMRGAGTDATALFDDTHRWVNFHGMLKACYVGQLCSNTASGSGRLLSVPSLPAPVPRPPVVSCECSGGSVRVSLRVPRLAMHGACHVCATLVEDGARLRVLVYDRQLVHVAHWRLCCRAEPQVASLHCRLLQQQRRVLITVRMRASDDGDDDDDDVVVMSDSAGTAMPDHGASLARASFSPSDTVAADNAPDFVAARLASREAASNACDGGDDGDGSGGSWLLTIQLPSSCWLSFPLGCHLLVCGERSCVLSRPYTVVTGALNETQMQPHLVHVLIKRCAGGAVSPVLTSLSPGDPVYLSVPFGSACEAQQTRWLMLAAGSGFTATVRLLQTVLLQDEDNHQPDPPTKVSLAVFSRRIEHIIWKQQLDELAEQCRPRLALTHVLSDEQSGGGGDAEEHSHSVARWRSGRVTTDLVAELLQQLDVTVPCADSDEHGYGSVTVVVCGPPGFMSSCRHILRCLHVPESSWLMFEG